MSAAVRMAQMAPADVCGATILIVDDERIWRLLLTTELELTGYRVLAAEDAEETLVLVERERPEVAVLDLMLPGGVDGWALYKELQARGHRLPTIFYSAQSIFRSQIDEPDVVAFVSKAADRVTLYDLLPAAVRAGRLLRNGA